MAKDTSNSAVASDTVIAEVNPTSPAPAPTSANLTTTAQIEQGNTVVQPLGAAQGEPTPITSYGDPLDGQKPNYEYTSPAQAAASGAQSVAQNDPEHALQNAKVAASKLHMMLQNVANVADAPFRELQKLLNDLATHIYKL